MKVGVISPPWISVPPPMYGGIELVVYNLVEGLTELGHEVILFAPKGSNISCRCIHYLEKLEVPLNSSLRERKLVDELSTKYAYAMCGYEGVDIIHDHTLAPRIVDIPVVHTLHGPAVDTLVNPCVEKSKKDDEYFVAISDRQKELYLKSNSNINFLGTVHNCIDLSNVAWNKDKEDFFLFVGRANWEKGLDLAIRVASKAQVNLKMAVKMSEDFEKEFFAKEIQPWIDSYPKHLKIEILEEIDRPQLENLFKRAKCTLFSSQWEEPFGLVMTESMACGTPVIALNRGAAPEVIVNGKTGFVVDTEDEMVEAVKNVDSLKPQDCRTHIEENFSRQKLAKEYLAIYEEILAAKSSLTETMLQDAK